MEADRRTACADVRRRSASSPLWSPRTAPTGCGLAPQGHAPLLRPRPVPPLPRPPAAPLPLAPPPPPPPPSAEAIDDTPRGDTPNTSGSGGPPDGAAGRRGVGGRGGQRRPG